MGRRLAVTLGAPAVLALAVALLTTFGEVSRPMSTADAMATLRQVVGYAPTDGRVLYSWQHCCADAPAGRLVPASRCVVYEFSEAGFKFKAWRNEGDWPADEGCWGPGDMQGCKGFLPGGLQLKTYAKHCHGPEGSIFRIDETRRIGVIETYTYD
jgi:hypothetical protein